ncbi:MAG: hypothetical protein FWF30_00980, partial [Coriobacteriia bacterium]|nr:hypothetical protein [Coriobacteriia bacterium]
MPLATFSNVRRLGTTLLAVVFALSLLPVQSIFAGSASDTPIDQSAAQTAAAPDGQSAATEAAAPDGQSAATETDTSAGTDGSATATLPATEASAPAADTLADSTAAAPEGSSPEGQSATEAATDAATAPATDTGPGATEATDTTAAASTGASQAIEPTGNAVVPIGQEPTTSQTPTTGGTQATGGTEAIDTGLVPVSAVSPASPATPASPASPATGSEPSSAPTYSVTYNANGGFGGAIDSQKYSAGDTVTVSYVAPTKVDVSGTYAFEGWAYTPDATYPAFIQNITPSTFKISQDTTLYAVWGAATPFMGITPADSNPSIHMHGGAGYTFIFYFTVPDTFNRSGLPIGSKMQNIGGVDYYVITLVGTSNTDSIATALDGHEYLAYVDIYRTSDGLLIEHVTEDHIGHVSDDTADLQNDGSMGSDGLVEVNTGVINFWYQYHSPVPNSLDVSIQANKQVTGTTAIPAGLFEFGLFDSNGVQVATATNDSNGNIVFTDPSLHYTDADLGNIYSFTIRELGFDPNAPESITKWWAPEDPSPEYTVTYRVILDNYVLTADFTAPADYPKSIVFTNHYTAHTSAVLEAQKLTDGRALEAEQFYFTIYDQDGVPVQYSTTSNDASGNIVFPEIAYQDINQDSSYTYTIKEDTPLPSGWTSNGDVYQAVVTFVADPESEGGYDTVVTYKYWDGSAWVPFSDPADLPTFTNTYKTTPTSWTPKATKTTDGRDMTDGQFSFALYNSDEEGDQGTLVGTATNSGTGTSGQVTFEDQIYDSPGTFYYLMVETSAGVNGWKTDTAQHLIKVTVTDNGDGTLTATPMLLGDTDWVPYSGPADITFANTYTTTDTSWTPMATKTATGRDMTAGQFAFTIYNSDDQGHQLDAIETATNAPGARNSAVDFTALGYNQPGTSYYLIEETSPGGAGWTADSTSYWVKVDVTDNGLGALVATATYWDGSAWATYSPAAVTFNNTYTTTKTSWTPEATKTTSGRDMADGQFSFALYSSDAAGTQGAEVETGTNTRDGDSSPVTFDPLTYDSPGTNYYLMVETSTDGGGWTVDSASYLFTVTVTDNGLGALTNIVGIAKWDGSAWQPYTDMPTFNNDYQASGSADLTAIKRVSGEPLLDHEFTFGVYEGTTLVSTGTNDENGLVTFEPIDYVLNADQDDTGTHSYTVVETGYSVPGDGHGWAMSEATFNVYVDVADSGHGTLTTNVRYDGGTPTFVNTYEADGSLTLKAAKATEGRTATAGQFSFVVLDEDDNVVATGTNASDGTVTFSSIPFKQDAIDKTFTYTIKELDTGLGGWAYDPNPYSVTVKVGDDLSGGLTFDVDYGTPGNVPPTFNNTYTTTDTSWTPAATKTSTGRSMTAGQFEFTLYNSDDQGAQLDAIETATNADPGTSSAVNFQYLTYDAPGTFYYLVKETSAGGQGWAVSTASYWVRVTVTDNGQGALVATPEYWNGSAWVPYSAAAVSFANTYTTTDTSWTPAATKTSTGRDMTAGQFEFTLYNSDDQGG